jgi:copper(I)-binding protein
MSTHAIAVVCAMAVAVLGLAGCGSSDNASTSSDTVQASDMWARATATEATNAAVYGDLTATGDEALVGAKVETSIADHVELHKSDAGMSSSTAGHMSESSGMSDMATMTPVHSVKLAAGKKVAFSPGGYHIMLVGLKAPLRAGMHVPLTLEFAHAPAEQVNVDVRE